MVARKRQEHVHVVLKAWFIPCFDSLWYTGFLWLWYIQLLLQKRFEILCGTITPPPEEWPHHIISACGFSLVCNLTFFPSTVILASTSILLSLMSSPILVDTIEVKRFQFRLFLLLTTACIPTNPTPKSTVKASITTSRWRQMRRMRRNIILGEHLGERRI